MASLMDKYNIRIISIVKNNILWVIFGRCSDLAHEKFTNDGH